MWSSSIVASLHYLALAIGLPAIFLRGHALKGTLDDAGLRRLFAADSMWGVAAALWLATGLLRAFAGLEKGSAFYLQSHGFYLKMGLFLAVVILEVRPMLTFMKWRQARRRGSRIDTSSARALFQVSHIQMSIVVAMVFVASAMARGLW
jgi:putative membrane protein